MKSIRKVVFLVLLVQFSCKPTIKEAKTEKSTPNYWASIELDSLKKFNSFEVLGLSTDDRLVEISGIVPSVQNKGMFWVHNDSGDKPRLFLVNTALEVQFTILFSDEVKHVDWEDITLSTKDAKTMITIADIGDNRALRKNVTLYQFEEPKIQTDKESMRIDQVEVMHLNYAKGPRDAEALAFDPIGQKFVIFSKRDKQVKVYLFEFSPGQKEIQSDFEVDLSSLNPSSVYPNMVTAADINSEGCVLLKNYEDVFLLTNLDDSSLEELMLAEVNFERVNYIPELQGEALCWDLINFSYYCTSEKQDDGIFSGIQPLFQYY
ncbi:MAG: hypothetical protein CMC18_07785 [Flavobacteriaceae bacterium]|nr:hypothetical protein [Flavobacteriaceae bacterium]|tara:strand:- start:2174 stop:3133 length:960 start_codon:yes stop_codon:yes gene_type:complete